MEEDAIATRETLTYEDDTGLRVSISIPRGGITGSEFVEELVRPLMLAVGYQPATVMEALGEYEHRPDSEFL